MSQTVRSRKLVSELSKKYFRCRMRKLENYSYPMERAKRVKFQKDNNESENNNNTFHNMKIIDDNNERDELNDDNNERDELNDDNNERDELNDDNNERDEFNSDSSITNNVVDDINICDAIENEVDNDFTPSHLATWCKTLNIPMTHADALLKDIRKHKCFRTIFPSAIRTILGTPKSTQLKIVPPGEYYHKGLVNELVRVLSKHNIENVNLTLNIDGLPLFKSSGQQLWPILISVAGIPGEIMVGAYCGNKKPNDINLFLEEFVNEIIYLINNGLKINNKLLPVRLQCISADAPAKSFLLSTKGHTGYDSCLKCFIHGKYVKNRVCFSGTNANLKTVIDFQNSNNILQFIPHIDFVRDVVLDYMHVVCIGVTKKLFTLWTTGNNYYKLSHQTKKRISDRLENSMNMSASLEFSRKPRSLEDLKYYKATEFRQLLLYTGPIVLQGLLDKDIYLNFLVLHVAMRILCMENASEEMIIYADKLLKNFNETFTILYGEENVSFNVHTLLHLANDVRKHGPLDSFSVFRFENFLQTIKSLIRKPQHILAQLHRRYVEIHNIDINKKNIRKNKFAILQESLHENGPLLSDCGDPQYSKIVGFGFTLIAESRRDNCLLTHDGTIVVLRNIAFNRITNSLVIIGQYFTVVEDLYTHPCKSQLVGIYLVSKLSGLKQWPLKGTIKNKCFIVPWKRNKNVVISLLHSNK